MENKNGKSITELNCNNCKRLFEFDRNLIDWKFKFLYPIRCPFCYVMKAQIDLKSKMTVRTQVLGYENYWKNHGHGG